MFVVGERFVKQGAVGRGLICGARYFPLAMLSLIKMSGMGASHRFLCFQCFTAASAVLLTGRTLSK